MSTGNPYAPPRGAVHDSRAPEELHLSSRAVLRNVVDWLRVIPLYGLVDLLAICGARQRCIHDLVADRIVVKA